MPEKSNHDFKSDGYGNEVLSLDLKNPFFVNKGVTSMRGTYTLAVYGKKKGTFVLSASQNKYPIMVMSEGVKVRKTQPEYETQLFKWDSENFEMDSKDIKIEVVVKAGIVDLYVNTFDQENDPETIVQKLPISRRSSAYSIPNIRPSSTPSQSQIIWQAADKDYCEACTYLIGVHTHQEASDYEVKVSVLTANFENSHFLKMGSPETLILGPNQTGVYKFIIDEKCEVQVTQTNNYGQTDTVVSLSPSEDGAIDRF